MIKFGILTAVVGFGLHYIAFVLCASDGPAKSWGFTVLLRKSSGQIQAGAIIDNFTILTQAEDIESIIEVIGGKYYEVNIDDDKIQPHRKVCSYSVHPDFDKRTLDYNYGLLHLYESIVGENAWAIPLPVVKKRVPRKDCQVTGWGKEKPKPGMLIADGDIINNYVIFNESFHCPNSHVTRKCIPGNSSCAYAPALPVFCKVRPNATTKRVLLAGYTIGASDVCTVTQMASMPGLPRDWLKDEKKIGESKCRNPTIPIAIGRMSPSSGPLDPNMERGRGLGRGIGVQQDSEGEDSCFFLQ